MRKLLTVYVAALALAIAASSPALASWVIEVPVVGLNGYYGPDTTQAVGTYNVSFDPDDVLEAQLRINGNLVWPSYYGCPSGNGIVNGCKFFANMPATSGDWFADAVYVDDRISFFVYLDWQASGSATWEFLSDGSGTVVLSGFARPLPAGCSYDHGSSDTTADVIDVKIIFELRDQTPVEQSTWGRIKSLFPAD